MVRNLIKYSLLYILIVGTFMVGALMIAEGLSGVDSTEIVSNGTFIVKTQIPNTNLYWYKIDMIGYLQNLEKTIQFNGNTLWPTYPEGASYVENSSVENILINIANSLIYIFNSIMWVLSTLVLLPIKIPCYIIFVFTAILGGNIGEIGNLVEFIYSASIPPIDYI